MNADQTVAALADMLDVYHVPGWPLELPPGWVELQEPLGVLDRVRWLLADWDLRLAPGERSDLGRHAIVTGPRVIVRGNQNSPPA